MNLKNLPGIPTDRKVSFDFNAIDLKEFPSSWEPLKFFSSLSEGWWFEIWGEGVFQTQKVHKSCFENSRFKVSSAYDSNFSRIS